MPDGSAPDAAVPPTPAPAAGTTWFVSTDSGRWVKPDGAERILSLAPEGLALWLSVAAERPADFDFMLAVGDMDAQDSCVRTITMNGLTLLPDGRFRFGPADFTLPNGTTAEDLELEGKFPTGMGPITEISAKARLDVSSIPRDVLPLMDDVDACGVVSALLQADCIPCRDGRVACLDVEMADYVGDSRDLSSTHEVQLADCHPECASSGDNMDCDMSGW